MTLLARYPLHLLAALLLFAQLAIGLSALVPEVMPAYRAQFLERTDCSNPAAIGRYELGATVRPVFGSADAAADGIFACGWHPAAEGLWSNSGGARLLFALPSQPAAWRIEIEAGGLVSETHPGQRVIATANGIALGTATVTGATPTRLVFEVPAEATADGRLEVALSFPDATSARAIGAGRERALRAIFVAAVTLTPQ